MYTPSTTIKINKMKKWMLISPGLERYVGQK
jgi:hypothetical protein